MAHNGNRTKLDGEEESFANSLHASQKTRRLRFGCDSDGRVKRTIESGEEMTKPEDKPDVTVQVVSKKWKK